MDSLNLIALTGFLERSPIIRWNENGQPTTTCTLRLEETGQGATVFKTFVVCEGYGRVAEQLGTYNAGDVVAVQGKLTWHTKVLASGEKKSSLAVLVRAVSVLIAAPETVAVAQSSGSDR